MSKHGGRELSIAEALEEVLLRHSGLREAMQNLAQHLSDFRKEVKQTLATLQEQVQTLTDTMTQMSTSMDVIGADVQTLVSDLQAANASTPPSVDLSPQIAQAQAILTRMQSAQAAATAGLPAAPLAAP